MKKMNKGKLQYFVILLLPLCFLSGTVMGQLKIMQPTELRNAISKKGKIGYLDYEISNFGLVDYMTTIKVELFRWSSDNGCDNPDSKMYENHSKYPRAFLIKRGDCTYFEQAMNAHKVGARVVLVYRDDDNDIHNYLPNKNEKEREKYRKSYQIPPVVVISKTDGEKILDQLKSSNQSVIIEFDYEIMMYTPPVNVQFVFSVIDSTAVETFYKLLDFNSKTKAKKLLMNLKPAPKLFTAEDLKYTNRDIQEFWYNNGKYCVMKTEHKFEDPRHEILISVIFTLLYRYAEGGNSNMNLALSYFKKYKAICLDEQIDNLLKWSLDVFEQNYKQSQLEIVRTSFLKTFDESAEENKIIDSDLLDQVLTSSVMDYNFIPAMYIEKNLVRGDILWRTAISALCDVLAHVDKPTQWFNIEKSLKSIVEEQLDSYREEINDEFKKYFILILISAIVVFIIYMASKYLLKERIYKDISSEINDTLERYYKIQALNKINFSEGDTELSPEDGDFN